MSVQTQFAEIARTDGRAALVTATNGPHAGARMLVHVDGACSGTLGDAELDAEGCAAAEELMWTEKSEMRGDLFIDICAPPPRLIIFGAVEYADHLSRLAKVAGWRSYVVDPRGRFATKDRFPEADDVIAAWPEKAFEQIGAPDPATYIAVLTHDPKLDDAVLLIALESDAAYIGAIGAKKTQKARRERLLAAGVSEQDMARISAPIGLDLGAKSTQETALSIMAEVAAVRHGADGGRLCAIKGEKRVHAGAGSAK